MKAVVGRVMKVVVVGGLVEDVLVMMLVVGVVLIMAVVVMMVVVVVMIKMMVTMMTVRLKFGNFLHKIGTVWDNLRNELDELNGASTVSVLKPGGTLPYMGYIGMCRCEGYGFQAVYSRIGYINQSVWV